MTQQGLRVAVLFGGPSVEHDVSIISAQQLMAVMEPKHEPVPVYLSRDGRWWTGDALRDIGAFGQEAPAGAEPCELRLGRDGAPFASPGGSRFKGDRDLQVDAAINSIHGTGGEDGSLLGALELSGIPYVGGGVAAAAVAMDKRLGKLVFREAGVEVCPHTVLHREDWTRRSPGRAAARGRAGTPLLREAGLARIVYRRCARDRRRGARGGARARLRAGPDGARRARARRLRGGERRHPREPPVGSAGFRGRAAGARHRGRPVLRGQVPARRRQGRGGEGRGRRRQGGRLRGHGKRRPDHSRAGLGRGPRRARRRRPRPRTPGSASSAWSATTSS